jgi:hypothetical protein
MVIQSAAAADKNWLALHIDAGEYMNQLYKVGYRRHDERLI